MKRNLCIAFCLLLITNWAVAQDVSFGMRMGPSFTSIRVNEVNFYTPVLGYHAGGYANIPLTNKVSFEPGLQYATKGANGYYIGSSGATPRDRFSYLDVPLAFKFDTNHALFFYLGAQPSFLISSKTIVRDREGSIIQTFGRDHNILESRFDFAGILGFGFNLREGLNLQIGYEHGFSDISDTGGGEFNRGIKFSLGKTF